jgi:TolA-binding protein
MLRRVGILILAVAPGLAFAANKDIQELQRDIALLQQQVTQLQQSQDRQLAAINAMVQQSIDAAGKANTSAAIIQNNLQQSLHDMETKVVAPVVGLGTRMDNMSNDFRTLQQAVSDLTSSLQKIQAQLTDVTNMVKVLQAPQAPPPGTSPATSPMPGQIPGGSANAAGSCAPASDLSTNANRDRQGGKLDLALQEYSDYLKCYGNTDFAPSAEFYIGFIHYSQADYSTAMQDFDNVLEKYPDNDRTPQALYYKGLSLNKMSRKTDAAAQYRKLIERFPRHDLAAQACSQLKDMGLRCPTAGTSHTTRKKKG